MRDRLAILAEPVEAEPQELAVAIRGLIEEFAAHHEAEERVVFSLLAQFKDVKSVVDEAWEEHAAIDLYLQRMRRSHPTVRWPAKTVVLRDLVELHMAREENRVFAAVEEWLGDGLEDLGTRFEAEKRRLLAVSLLV